MTAAPASSLDAGAIDPAIVGAAFGPLETTVDARWLMAYAAALGERDPRYFDTGRAAGPAAHPLFAVCYEWPAALAVRAGVLGDDVAGRGVHLAHRLTIHRAPRAGDALRTSARVVALDPRPSGALLTIRFTTVDADDAPVTTTDHASLYRGVRVARGATAGAAAPETRRPAPASDDDVRWIETVPVDAGLAHVYTECARIWNPIHTDRAVARAAGLPDIILHGTATLGLAVSRVVARDLGGEPVAVRGIAGRFTGMVAVPSRLTVRGRAAAAGTVAFDVLDADGKAVLSQGAIHR
jgi:acyl dehydratase